MSKIYALVVAGGVGERLGGDMPKQYLSISGTPILRQSILAFANHPAISGVRSVINEEHQDYYKRISQNLECLPPVFGGDTRQKSVRLGLESLTEFVPDIVLIHDAARPFVDAGLIDRVIAALETSRAVIPGIPVTDTTKKVSGEVVIETLPREQLSFAQTPQGFHFDTIMDLHKRFADMSHFSDDASLCEQGNVPVQVVLGNVLNRKITTMVDITQSIPHICVGHGFDTHAIGPGENVMLLGVSVPSGFSLIGHSDADVGLHSITDALLGAIGDGDIGIHFSPQDERWKGEDSGIFLKHAAQKVRERGAVISHVDVTIIGEKPKVSPYRDAMIARLMELLDLDRNRVSVKATTTEQLGFCGRGEGLAAFATATVVYP